MAADRPFADYSDEDLHGILDCIYGGIAEIDSEAAAFGDGPPGSAIQKDRMLAGIADINAELAIRYPAPPAGTETKPVIEWDGDDIPF